MRVKKSTIDVSIMSIEISLSSSREEILYAWFKDMALVVKREETKASLTASVADFQIDNMLYKRFFISCFISSLFSFFIIYISTGHILFLLLHGQHLMNQFHFFCAKLSSSLFSLSVSFQVFLFKCFL